MDKRKYQSKLDTFLTKKPRKDVSTDDAQNIQASDDNSALPIPEYN